MARPRCSTTNKTRFPSKLEADLALVGIQSRNKKRRKQKFREEPQRSYPCPACGGFHLTSMA